MADYKITIENKMFKEHLNNIRQDPTTKNAKNFNGDEWMVPILTEMQKAEDNIEIQIQIDKARIYEQSKRLTNYITINGHCKLCSTKYTIVSEHKPDENESYSFTVKKTIEHNKEQHTKIMESKISIRGKNREDLAKSILLNDNESAKSYADAQAGKNYANVPNVAVMRNCISQYINKEMVSTNWITNLLHQSEVFKIK